MNISNGTFTSAGGLSRLTITSFDAATGTFNGTYTSTITATNAPSYLLVSGHWFHVASRTAETAVSISWTAAARPGDFSSCFVDTWSGVFTSDKVIQADGMRCTHLFGQPPTFTHLESQRFIAAA